MFEDSYSSIEEVVEDMINSTENEAEEIASRYAYEAALEDYENNSLDESKDEFYNSGTDDLEFHLSYLSESCRKINPDLTIFDYTSALERAVKIRNDERFNDYTYTWIDNPTDEQKLLAAKQDSCHVTFIKDPYLKCEYETKSE